MARVANIDGSSLAAVAVAVAAASTNSAQEGRPTIRLASGIRPAGSVALAQFDSQPNSARIGRSQPLQQAVSPARTGIRPPNHRPETPPVVMRRHNASATAPPGMTQASSPNRPSPSTAASPPSLSSQHLGTGRGRLPAKQRTSSVDLVETLDGAHPRERGAAHSSPYVRSSGSATRSPVLGAINGKVSVPAPQRSLSRAMAPGPARSQQQFQQSLLQTCQVRPHEAIEELSSQLSRSSPSSYMLQPAPKLQMEKTVSQLQMAQASASPSSMTLQHGLVHRDVEEDFDVQAITTPRRNFHPSSSSTPLRQKNSSTHFQFSASPTGRSPSPPTSFQQTSGGSVPRRAPQRSQSASMMSSLSQNQRGPTQVGGHSQADHVSPRRNDRLQAPGFSSPPVVVKENPELLGNSFSKRNTLPRSFVSAWRRDGARTNDSLVSPRGAAAVVSSAKPSLDNGSRQQRSQMLSSPSSAAMSSAPNTSRKASGYVNCSGGTSRSAIVSTYASPAIASAIDETAAKVERPEASSRRGPTQVSNGKQEGVGNASSSSSTNALRLEIGTCSLQGLKSGNPNWINQDTSLIFKFQPSLTLVAVFDGHGENGRLISDRVKALFEQFAEPLILQGNANVQGGLCQLFALVQSVLDREGMSRLSGTTATIAVIDQAASSMVTAHTGDSKMMLIRAAEVEFETIDHVVDANDERRVIAAGGEVRELDGSANAGVRRIFMRGQHLPGLAMSRSLGDIEAHNIGALAEPEISATLSIKHGDVVILASDGVWDKLPREFVAANVGVSRAEPSAHAMAFAARAGWPPEGDIDDITAVVVQVFAADDLSERAEGVSANCIGISSGSGKDMYGVFAVVLLYSQS